MDRQILVPVDESDRSKEALEFALEEHADAEIIALHVLDPGDYYSATGMEGGAMANYDRIQEQQEKRAEGVLEDAQAVAAEHGLEIRTDHVMGGVSRTIVEYAGDNEIDQIVIGSHGRTGASRILIGSVAETVARRSPVPVTIVR